MDTVTQRAIAIRAAVPDVLKHQFEIQNKVCDLCGHLIQDLICAALDHSVPVIRIARSSMSIEEAIAVANDPKNLRCAHASCNHAKLGLTREEWFARGLNERDTPRFLTEGQLLELQFRLGTSGRMHGPINGRNAVRNRTGIYALGYDKTKGGCIGGRITVEHKIGIHAPEMYGVGGRIGGKIAGRKHFENKTGPFAPEHRGKGGRKNVESGHLARIRTPEHQAAAGRATAAIPGNMVKAGRARQLKAFLKTVAWG